MTHLAWLKLETMTIWIDVRDGAPTGTTADRVRLENAAIDAAMVTVNCDVWSVHTALFQPAGTWPGSGAHVLVTFTAKGKLMTDATDHPQTLTRALDDLMGVSARIEIADPTSDVHAPHEVRLMLARLLDAVNHVQATRERLLGGTRGEFVPAAAPLPRHQLVDDVVQAWLDIQNDIPQAGVEDHLLDRMSSAIQALDRAVVATEDPSQAPTPPPPDQHPSQHLLDVLDLYFPRLAQAKRDAFDTAQVAQDTWDRANASTPSIDTIRAALPPSWNDVLDCAWCGRRLERPGAVLLSPPLAGTTKKGEPVVVKRHICDECYEVSEDAIVTPGAVLDAPESPLTPLLPVSEQDLAALLTEALDRGANWNGLAYQATSEAIAFVAERIISKGYLIWQTPSKGDES